MLDKTGAVCYYNYRKGKEIPKMNEFREKLIDRMIKKFGFEHPNTIAIANLCEATWISDEALEKAVEHHEANSIFED